VAFFVMAGHSRSKNGVASLAYVPAIHVFVARKEDVDARIRGHDGWGNWNHESDRHPPLRPA
jgi:hypothetical protein